PSSTLPSPHSAPGSPVVASPVVGATLVSPPPEPSEVDDDDGSAPVPGSPVVEPTEIWLVVPAVKLALSAAPSAALLHPPAPSVTTTTPTPITKLRVMAPTVVSSPRS